MWQTWTLGTALAEANAPKGLRWMREVLSSEFFIRGMVRETA